MSLINDALKRASQSDRNRPRPDATHAPMKPVAGGRGWSLPLALGVGVAVALALAGWSFLQWWKTGHSNAPVTMEAAAVAPKPAPVAREAIPPPQPQPAPAPVIAPPAPAPAPPAIPVEPPWPAKLKLMGIFFNTTSPYALINGKTVAPGDKIAGIRVTTIESDRVTVEWNGQVKELKIE